LVDGLPWGKRTSKDTNYYDMDAIPNTGVTRNYDWMLVNGQFPGPLVEANWGDWIEVKVKNNLTELEEGTAIHWHGQVLGQIYH
jgi:FtsP/CotA-like multicopper oxidase with cupredoxin domain